MKGSTKKWLALAAMILVVAGGLAIAARQFGRPVKNPHSHTWQWVNDREMVRILRAQAEALVPPDATDLEEQHFAPPAFDPDSGVRHSFLNIAFRTKNAETAIVSARSKLRTWVFSAGGGQFGDFNNQESFGQYGMGLTISVSSPASFSKIRFGADNPPPVPVTMGIQATIGLLPPGEG